MSSHSEGSGKGLITPPMLGQGTAKEVWAVCLYKASGYPHSGLVNCPHVLVLRMMLSRWWHWSMLHNRIWERQRLCCLFGTTVDMTWLWSNWCLFKHLSWLIKLISLCTYYSFDIISSFNILIFHITFCNIPFFKFLVFEAQHYKKTTYTVNARPTHQTASSKCVKLVPSENRNLWIEWGSVVRFLGVFGEDFAVLALFSFALNPLMSFSSTCPCPFCIVVYSPQCLNRRELRPIIIQILLPEG